MLPEQAVLVLRDVIKGDPHCFDTLMIAKTHPIPKQVGIPTVQKLRPITVLPQTYRLWSRVASFAILQIMGRKLPQTLTGFLPGRGPTDSSFEFQHVVEKAHWHKQHCSGISIDLVKCFNSIKRPVAAALLARLGAPQDLVSRWMIALGTMLRVWTVHRFTSAPQPTNCGLPEGDALSVVGMLCVSRLDHICGKRYAPG